MKIFLIVLLLASLAANAILFKDRSSAVADSSPTDTSASVSAKTAAVTAPPLSVEAWDLIKTGDAASVEKLRALGIDEHILRRVVRARAELRYREKEQALMQTPNYWQRSYTMARYRPTDPLKALDLRREKDAELKTLLGENYRDEDDYADPRTAFLPPGKAEELRLIQEDYDALSQSTYTYDGSIMLPEDREKLAYIEKQKRADLAALLTPEELAAYELRNSTTAGTLAYQLRDSDFTEEEYKSIYALRKPFDEQFTTNYGGMVISNDQAKARQQAEEALNKQIKAALGDDRYAAYQRAQDQDYKMLSKLTKRLELPPENAVDAHILKTSLEQKLKDFKPQPGTPPMQQRTEHLAALSREAETGFTQLLGEKGYAAYKENSQFFRRLQPPTPPPAAPKP